MDLLAQMDTFVRVVEMGTLSGAARRTGQSLAAVSRQISALEADLGGALLIRTTRKLSITDAGHTFHERCLRVLAEVDGARQSVRGDRAMRGRLVVSAPVSLGLERADALFGLTEAHRSLSIDLRLEDRVVDLVAEGVDVAIRVGIAPPDSTVYVAHTLRPVRRVVVAAPSWLAKHGRPRSPSALALHKALLHLPAAGESDTWVLRGEDGDEARIPMQGAMRSNALVVLRDLAIAGHGVAMVPDFLVTEALTRGALEHVLPKWEGPNATAYAVHPAALRSSAKIRALVERLRSAW
ncbi:MAG TPA: LysR family transcriptional regulator [Kofleriaceae bacterium]|jgi:DNA-binding transcriptional LysR family regulator